MPDLIDYLRWRGDLSFDADPFNEADNLVLSLLSYADFSKAVSRYHSGRSVLLPDAVGIYEKFCPDTERLGAVIPKKLPELIRLAPRTKRFSKIRVSAFVSETDKKSDKQFCAVTFILPDGTLFVSFRGTDDTLVGWREDFTLSYSSPAESQLRAVGFLEEAALSSSGGIRLGGHSKGGNLAFYAAVFCRREVQDRIIASYSNDGPGFEKYILESDEYKRAEKKLVGIVPESSFVGLLLEHSARCKIVASGAAPLLQHDPFTWEVMGNGFVWRDALSYRGLCHELTLKEWLASIDEDGRRRFTDIFFGILEKTGAETLTDLGESKLKSAVSILKAIADLSAEEREHMGRLLKLLLDMSRLSDKKLKNRK